MSFTSIDFDEDEPSFNGVIHRHPTGCNTFSGTDDQYINSNFEFSILYEGGKFVTGIVNTNIAGARIQLPLAPVVEYPMAENTPDEDAVKEKIIVPERPKHDPSSSSIDDLIDCSDDGNGQFMDMLNCSGDDIVDLSPALACRFCGYAFGKEELSTTSNYCPGCERAMDIESVVPINVSEEEDEDEDQ